VKVSKTSTACNAELKKIVAERRRRSRGDHLCFIITIMIMIIIIYLAATHIDNAAIRFRFFVLLSVLNNSADEGQRSRRRPRPPPMSSPDQQKNRNRRGVHGNGNSSNSGSSGSGSSQRRHQRRNRHRHHDDSYANDDEPADGRSSE